MKRGMERLVARSAFVVVALWLSAVDGASQERVALIRPVGADPVPAQVRQRFEQSLREAAPGVVLVNSIVEASIVIELARYEWNLGEESVGETWRFYHFWTIPSGDEPAGRTRLVGTVIFAKGRTASECAQDSSEMLRKSFAGLLPPPRWVPR
jgi:hypothetical protein